MQYKIIQNEDDLIRYKEIWTNAYNSTNNRTIFQSFHWNYEWWKNQYSDLALYIIIFFKDTIEQVCAIFPLVLNKKGVLKSIADTHSDYCNLLIKTESDYNKHELFKTFKKIIEADNTVSAILLNNLQQSLNFLGLLSSYFDIKQITLQTNASSYVTFNNCKETIECFSYLKAKKKNQIKRLYKQCDIYQIDHYMGKNSPFPNNTIKKILHDMISRGARKKDFLHHNLLKVIKEIYASNEMIIQKISKNNEPVAINFILHPDGSNNYLMWISAYKAVPKINIISYYLLIDHLNKSKSCENGFIIDFGRGLYDYKIVNFLPSIDMHYTFFYSKSYSDYINFLLRSFFKLSIKPFYKKHKSIINKVLKR